MRASVEARVMLHPFRAYRELARDPEEGAARALRRAFVLLLTLGAFVSFTAAGRLVALHVVSGALFWGFAPATTIAALFLATRRLPQPRRLGELASLYLAGNGPWLSFLVGVSGLVIFAPGLFVAERLGLVTRILGGLLLSCAVWGMVATFAFFRAGLGLPPWRASARAALFYAAHGCLVVSWYLAQNQIQPQLAGGS